MGKIFPPRRARLRSEFLIRLGPQILQIAGLPRRQGLDDRTEESFTIEGLTEYAYGSACQTFSLIRCGKGRHEDHGNFSRPLLHFVEEL